MRKRLFRAVTVLLVLLIASAQSGAAVDHSRVFTFSLTVDGREEKTVQTGDIITVVFALDWNDWTVEYPMYGMQNEILYDGDFFTLVEGSILTAPDIRTVDLGMVDHYRALYMNFVSFGGGSSWMPHTVVGSFQLRVTGTEGVSTVRCEHCLVSTADGMDSFECRSSGVKISIPSQCTVRFDSRGGSPVAECVVPAGQRMSPPPDPVKEGYVFGGWYREAETKTPWDFAADTVENSMTLYARWERSPAFPFGIATLLLLLAGLAVLLFRRKRKKQ